MATTQLDEGTDLDSVTDLQYEADEIPERRDRGARFVPGPLRRVGRRMQEKRDARAGTRNGPRTTTIVRWGVAMFVVAVVAAAVVAVNRATEAVATANAAATIARQEVSDRIPLGFGADCVSMWLEAGVDRPDPYMATCHPGVTLAGSGQKAAQLTADRVTPYEFPYTTVDPDNPEQFSVFVSAWLRERMVGEDGTVTWVPTGIHYYRADVVVTPEGDNLARHPYEVFIAQPEQPAVPAIAPGPIDMGDPRTALLSDYVKAQATGGFVNNYFTPGGDGGRALPEGQVTSAQLMAVGYSDDESADAVDAICVVALHYSSGNVVTTSPAFRLSRDETTWTIDSEYRNVPLAPRPTNHGN